MTQPHTNTYHHILTQTNTTKHNTHFPQMQAHFIPSSTRLAQFYQHDANMSDQQGMDRSPRTLTLRQVRAVCIERKLSLLLKENERKREGRKDELQMTFFGASKKNIDLLSEKSSFFVLFGSCVLFSVPHTQTHTPTHTPTDTHMHTHTRKKIGDKR